MAKDISIRLNPKDASSEKLIRKALHISSDEKFVIIRKSIDARRRDIFVDLTVRVDPEDNLYPDLVLRHTDESSKQAIIVGSGPAGLFAALTLLENGIRPTVIERGKDVHSRRVDIARISRENTVHPNSNYSFGEGGAGTYSDGKLFTRSKKRGDNTKVLSTFVKYGADPSILYETHPHIGTDRLPKIIEAMRQDIIAHGGLFLFETLVTDLVIRNGICTGVVTENLNTHETEDLTGPVILAIGNAARDTFEMLKRRNVALEAKSLAMGVRLEHPQALIDQIQYHSPNGRGEYLPAAQYSFSAQVDTDEGRLGVYSFCMCPGGFVVPAASDNGQVVVNGMSPSNRGSVWANSGMVTEFPVELVRKISSSNAEDPLDVMRFQSDLERHTFECASRTQKAPSQRMTDFLQGRVSSDLPRSSYAPGLTSFDMNDVLPQFAAQALKKGFEVFSRSAQGFLTEQAILIGTETRTSSPVRIVRDDTTLESMNTKALYPCGEGAGYAGGIVSAAIDGIRCAQMISLRQ